ncbi:hypothetical protein [Iodobacter fluviatilis]|uniref:Uncharacterized protein n=1 Tax=Iodobacter fluviatilis TaxID=537 RepID=A0A7G3GBL3_9NEIS|nr:hypothetical protein [Iodobacter fluviatilis]QBC44432.1 hypothetical protein C1H71_13435 [Iodobacter fluviatilis]
MNRASRRKKVLTPTIFEVRSAFLLIDQMFDDLRTGQLEFASIEGGPEYAVFRDKHDDRLPIVPALDGWINCWERLGKDMHFSIDQQPLRVLMQVLDIPDAYLTSEQIAAASAVVENQRRMYRTLDVYKVRSTAVTEQTAILLEKATA